MEHIYNDKLEILKAYNNLTRNGKLIINNILNTVFLQGTKQSNK